MRWSRFIACVIFGLVIFGGALPLQLAADEVDPLVVTPGKPDQPIRFAIDWWLACKRG